ncbi:MAG: aldose 1-epimerase [Alphaproteobacteria bacterium]|nr:aldose 1-epimerase [Alphaproteobacteria bacterium]MBO4644623.1 aldose 1-epimerase [Alphaproteobacteria bacterium]
MTNTDIVSLSSGDFSAAVSPVAGGSLLYWRQGKEDLTRPALEGAVSRKAADETSMFPLVPYSNRIRGGYFIYWGIKRNVPKNHPVVPDPLHGEGWQRQWNVEQSNPDSVTLSFEHNGKNGFPFAYEAEQSFVLKGNQLIVSMTLTNKGGIPMPCGLGWHPFFPKDDDTLVCFKSKNVWAHESAPPRERPMKTPPEWQFDKGLKISELELDTCFGGFDGKAELIWPSRNRKINITAYSDFGHIVIWSPAGQNFFCVEPVTNATDAFNLASRGVAGTGIKTLDPEESLTETMTLAVSEI